MAMIIDSESAAEDLVQGRLVLMGSNLKLGVSLTCRFVVTNGNPLSQLQISLNLKTTLIPMTRRRRRRRKRKAVKGIL